MQNLGWYQEMINKHKNTSYISFLLSTFKIASGRIQNGAQESQTFLITTKHSQGSWSLELVI